MQHATAHEVICRLDAGSKKRLDLFCRNLSTDKDPEHEDDKVIQYLREICLDVEWFDAEFSYLKSLKWNQSKYAYEQIVQAIERFEEDEADYFGWNKGYARALKEFKAEAEKYGLRSLQYDGNVSIVDSIPRRDTHAGFPFIETGLKEKGMYYEDIYQRYLEMETEARKCRSFNEIILPGSRTQASMPYDKYGRRTGEFKHKTRLVSMISIWQIIAELKTAKRFQMKIGVLDWYAGGKSDERIANIIRRYRRKYRHWLSIDYSAYDQSISSWAIHDAFDVIQCAYKHDPNFDEEMFRIIRFDFINKVFIDGDQNPVPITKGVPSGSMFTQIIDSIVNRLMITSYMYNIGVEEFDMMIMGDDNLVFTQVKIDTVDLQGYLDRNFGIEMHPKKCDEGTNKQDPEFLSRTWTVFGVYRRPEVLLAKLAFPERFRDYKRGGFTPAMVVESYFETFPLGMKEKFSIEKHRNRILVEHSSVGSDQWLTGLMRYRKLYLS